MFSISKKKFLLLLLTVFLNFSVFQQAWAYDKELINNFITLKFDDNGPVTTLIDVRYSLWRSGPSEAGEIDNNGDIIESSENYGGWQQVVAYTPDAQSQVGIDLFNPSFITDFPEIYDSNAFLQVEFKYPSEDNTAYRVVDMLRDSPDLIKRFLLVNNLIALSPHIPQKGSTSNNFTLDIDFNANQFVTLIFGENAKSLSYDLLSNWFNLDGRLNLNGFPGIKLAINAHASDNGTELLSIRNSAGETVFYVDENGHVTGSTLQADTSLTLPAGSGSSSPILKHLAVQATNVTSANIEASGCSDYATISVPGAAVGDSVVATPTVVSGGIETVNLSWNAIVSSTNNVLIRACNPALTAVNTANTQTWRVDIWGH